MFLKVVQSIPGIDSLTDDWLLSVLLSGALVGVALGKGRPPVPAQPPQDARCPHWPQSAPQMDDIIICPPYFLPLSSGAPSTPGPLIKVRSLEKPCPLTSLI